MKTFMSLFLIQQGLSNGHRAGELRPRWRFNHFGSGNKTPSPTIRCKQSSILFDGLEPN